MSATLLNGRELSLQILKKIKNETDLLVTQPGLAVVLVGDDPASKIYVNNKEEACQEVGFLSRKIHLPENTSREELLAVIADLNTDSIIHGILVQLPLPQTIRLYTDEFLNRIDPKKDVDGLNAASSFMPCTPKGIMRLLEHYQIPIIHQRAAVLGRSRLVGRPMATLLQAAGAEVDVIHSQTVNAPDIVRQADIVVSAIGQPKLVTADWIKAGATVVDVGINRTDTGLTGDVDFAAVKEKAAFITPVPGGVGPMTVAMLMENVLLAARATLLPVGSGE